MAPLLTSWTPAVGVLTVCARVSESVRPCVCESVCPRTCRHIARRMLKTWSVFIGLSSVKSMGHVDDLITR